MVKKNVVEKYMGPTMLLKNKITSGGGTCDICGEGIEPPYDGAIASVEKDVWVCKKCQEKDGIQPPIESIPTSIESIQPQLRFS